MKDDSLSRARLVTDPRTAAVFSDPLRRHLVLLFARSERSLAEVASTTGLGLKRLHYHVTALRKRGLIKVTRTQRRAGRPIKFYRAIADSFLVPAGISPFPPHARLHAELRESIAMLRDQSLEGTLYDVGEDGGPRMQSVQGPAHGPAACAEHWRVLHLSRADAARLAKDIGTLLADFATSRSGAGRPHLVHFAVVPRR